MHACKSVVIAVAHFSSIFYLRRLRRRSVKESFTLLLLGSDPVGWFGCLVVYDFVLKERKKECVVMRHHHHVKSADIEYHK